ncbi:CDK5RAP3-like protein [Camellia lanceoleosa]|nr:CDK5RAP3-like protein [Camellia lanceoleosa]
MMMVWNLMRPLLNKKEDVVVLEVSVSEISWDISVENPQVHVIEDTACQMRLGVSYIYSKYCNETQEIAQQRSHFWRREYWNKVLDDLFEIKAFLNQWLTGLTNNETRPCNIKSSAVAPLVFLKDSSDTIRKMLSMFLWPSPHRQIEKPGSIMILNSKGLKSRISAALVSVVKEHASYGEITESKASSTSLFFDTITKLFLA